MPAINNIDNVSNSGLKKVQSKLSFQVEDIFQAKVIDSQGSDVVLKTTDGWQFAANAKVPLENLPKGLVKFKVVGYENEKLQITVVPEESDGDDNAPEKSIQTILKQQNISSSSSNLEMLKSMVKHGISLTKENISAVKTIVDFKDKISSNEDEEEIFINKYLQSKGIDQNSDQGKNITTLLKSFFGELKKASVEDLVTLKENGIDITEDNLKSFNKVFKEDTGLYKEITQNTDFINSINYHNLTLGKDNITPKVMQTILENDIPATKENISNMEAIIDLKEEIIPQPKNEAKVIDKYLNSKNIPEGSESGKALKASIKEFFEVIKNEPVKEVLAKLQTDSKVNTQVGVIKNFENQFTQDLPVFKEIIKDVLKNNEAAEHNELKAKQTILENHIPETEKNMSNVKTIIDLKEEIIAQPKKETEVIDKHLNSKNIPGNSDMGKALNTINTVQNPIRMNESSFKDVEELKIVQTIVENDIPLTKENVSNLKAIIDLKEKILVQPQKENDVISQYLGSKDIDENSDSGKALIEDIKEFFDTIKKEPVKETFDKLQQDQEVKAEGESVKTFEKQFKEDMPVFKEIIKGIIKGGNFEKNLELSKRSEVAENIKNEITQKTDFMKDIIKGLKDGDWSVVKNSINDIKVFNTVSNQYYYMDVPVNVDQRQYECKLWVKDDRTKGKRIDSKNVKMFVSVKTINMGKVDAYIKVIDRNLTINLKCKENFIKVFENENNKLIGTLQDMNYNVNLKVEKQVEEANIVTTREFFQDSTIGSINVMV